MATWESKTLRDVGAPHSGVPVWRRPPYAPQLIIVVGLILFLVGTAPYWSRSPFGTEFVSAPPRTASAPSPHAVVQRPSPSSPSPEIAVQRPSSPAPRAQLRRTPQQGSQTARRVPGGRQFVVSFGRFSRRTPAETAARAIRGKGYLATVRHVGGAFHVFSRAFRDRESAEFWSKVYSDIGLHARVLTVSASARTITIDTDSL